jgi:site-specific DNA-methyltransferase (adenine-specific)
MNEIKCIDVIKGLNELEPGSADIILADPPYNIGKDFGNSKDNMSLENYIRWSFDWIYAAEEALKESGTMYIYGFAEILAHISAKLEMDHRWLVWHYKNRTTPTFKSFWQRSHESILCCWKNEKKRIFNVDDVREPYTETFLQNAAGKVRKNTKGRFSKGDLETTYTANALGALPRDVLEVPALAGGAGAVERWFMCKSCNDKCYPNKLKKEHDGHDIVQHPTQKPYELTNRLLKAAKPKEGGLVVIPFVGSGAECAVVEDLGMSFVGFDINPDYVKLAQQMLEKRKSGGMKSNE